MPLHLLPSLLLYILLVGYSPGPANLYSFSCALKYGRRQSLKMWRGLLVGFCIILVVSVFLCHFIGEAVGPYVVWLKYLGAAYILWLAYKIWRAPADASAKVEGCNFVSGLLVQLTNVKIILFELTMFSMFVLPYTDDIGELFKVGALLLLAGPVANLAWLLAGEYLRRFFNKKMQVVDAVLALLLAVCAIFIVFH
ncbi:MAG: LysE family transporter [Bacteroidaceae bacterium]|nr:LysE family transporter [Bacteroidaceae bacterium]